MHITTRSNCKSPETSSRKEVDRRYAYNSLLHGTLTCMFPFIQSSLRFMLSHTTRMWELGKSSFLDDDAKVLIFFRRLVAPNSFKATCNRVCVKNSSGETFLLLQTVRRPPIEMDGYACTASCNIYISSLRTIYL